MHTFYMDDQICSTWNHANFIVETLELKSQWYFEGIEWEIVAKRESEPPFNQPNPLIEAQINWEDRSQFEKMVGVGLNETLEPSIVERLQSNFIWNLSLNLHL